MDLTRFDEAFQWLVLLVAWGAFLVLGGVMFVVARAVCDAFDRYRDLSRTARHDHKETRR